MVSAREIYWLPNATNRLAFAIDAFTVRLCERLGIKDLKYDELKDLFESSLPRNLEVYKDFCMWNVKPKTVLPFLKMKTLLPDRTYKYSITGRD